MCMNCIVFPGSHDEYQKTVDWLMSQTKHRPQVAIICGSGLGMLADTLKCQDSFAYADIPGFSQSTGTTKYHCFTLFQTEKICTVFLKSGKVSSKQQLLIRQNE